MSIQPPVLPAVTVWKPAVRSNTGRPTSTYPMMMGHVKRSERLPNYANLTLDARLSPTRLCNIFFDGNGRLAFEMTDRGRCIIMICGTRRRINIPSAYVQDLIPMGRHEVFLTQSDGFVILNTADLIAAQVAS